MISPPANSSPPATRTPPRENSIGRLMKSLAFDTRVLLKQEVELVKAEMSEKASRLARNAVYMAVGGLVLYAGLLTLIAAACVGTTVALAQGMDATVALWLGPLIIGVVVALIGYAFVQAAINTFKKESFTPRKTMQSLREGKEWIKDQMTTRDTPRH